MQEERIQQEPVSSKRGDNVNDASYRSSTAFEHFREILPTQFVDEVLYTFVLCKYGDEGEELLDKVPAALDNKVREVLHDYFVELDKLSMEHINLPASE